mgnify:CR=1 FL=1
MRLRAGVAIDLGTVNTLVYVAGRGLVIDEPSAIAARPDDWQRDRGGAGRGRSGWARSLQGVDVIHPLRDGVVADLTRRWPCCRRSCAGLTCAAARCGRSAVICVPGGATWVEQRSLAVAAGRSSPGATSSSSKSRSPPPPGPARPRRRVWCVHRGHRGRDHRGRGGDQRSPGACPVAAAGRQRDGRGDRAGRQGRPRLLIGRNAARNLKMNLGLTDAGDRMGRDGRCGRGEPHAPGRACAGTARGTGAGAQSSR